MNSNAEGVDCSFHVTPADRRTRAGRRHFQRAPGEEESPVNWHGNKLCSNMTQKRGKRASAPERVEYEFRSGARISQGLPSLGHGTAAMSKAMPSAKATATAAVHFPMDRHRAVPSSCSRGDKVTYASRN